MKRLILLLILCLSYNNINAKCTNTKHTLQKTKKDPVTKKWIQTYYYTCHVKADNPQGTPDPFDNATRACKTCGCHKNYHNDD